MVRDKANLSIASVDVVPPDSLTEAFFLIQNKMEKQQATDFFAEFYRGEHHIPGFEPKPYGLGWSVLHDRGDLATFDFNELTRLVLMGHEKCIRVGIEGVRKNTVRICIWQRVREGGMSERHPTIENAIEDYLKYKK